MDAVQIDAVDRLAGDAAAEGALQLGFAVRRLRLRDAADQQRSCDKGEKLAHGGLLRVRNVGLSREHINASLNRS